MTGIASQIGWAIEGTPKTRQTPTKFAPFVSESLKCDQGFIRSAGIGAGRRYNRAKAAGNKNVAGGIQWELQAQTMATLLRLCLGGSIVTAGSNPYTHTVAGGALPTATFQVGRGAIGDPFDYTGCMVNQWTIACNPNEYATIALDLYCYDELTNQSLASYTPAGTITPLTFQSLAITTPDGAVCFDGFTLTGNNNLEQSFKSCATDAGRATIRENGMRTITGTLNGDFVDMTAYDRYLAGTEGTLEIKLTNGSSAILDIDMTVFYTGETPNVGGPGVVKQSIGFEVIHATTDATAITAVLTNTDSTA